MIQIIILVGTVIVFLGAMIPIIHKSLLDNKLEYIDELVKRGLMDEI